MSPKQAAITLVETTIAMHEAGIPLMRRVLPIESEITLWDHYPENDAVSPHGQSRYFYHCHPVEERGPGEHGHFHLFLPKAAMPALSRPRLTPLDLEADRADVVHIAALSVTPTGLPTAMFTVNRWVTDEWLYSRDDIMAVIKSFDLTDADGDPLVNLWLTAMVRLAYPLIDDLLVKRDVALGVRGWDGEARDLEILSHAAVDLQTLVDSYLD